MLTEDLEIRTTTPNKRTQLYIDDVASVLCAKTNCPSADGMCNHKQLAFELVQATVVHYIDIFDKAGNSAAAELLRGEV